MVRKSDKFGQKALTTQLNAKNRARRDRLSQAVERPLRPPRNDVMPILTIEEVPLEQLQFPARRIRASHEAHVREVACSIQALGFCVPLLIGKGNIVLDGLIRVEAARFLGLKKAPCIRVDFLSEAEQRTLRLAVNRLGEKGMWKLDELQAEFNELILTEAPIEIVGFSPEEIDQILLIDDGGEVESGPLEPAENEQPIARTGDTFQLGAHLLTCGDACEPEVLGRLFSGNDVARLILTDVPYNVPIAGHVTSGSHREFKMAAGEMSDEQFFDFNVFWISQTLRIPYKRRHLRDVHRLAREPHYSRRSLPSRSCATEFDRLDEVQCRNGQSLQVPARVASLLQERHSPSHQQC